MARKTRQRKLEANRKNELAVAAMTALVDLIGGPPFAVDNEQVETLLGEGKLGREIQSQLELSLGDTAASLIGTIRNALHATT